MSDGSPGRWMVEDRPCERCSQVFRATHARQRNCVRCAHRKATLVFPAEMIEEMHRFAKAHDRSVSWVVSKAWRLARARIKALAPE